MRLAYQPPYDWAAMLGFLSARAITGLETVEAGVYRRSISVNGQHGCISVAPGAGDWLEVGVEFPDAAALPEIERRLRAMFDLDARPGLINAQLAADPLMAQLVAARPGLRVPGTWDGLELAIRAVLGQQITVVAAIRLAGKLVAQYGQPLQTPYAGITHVFPVAEVLAAADLATLGMPKARGRTLSGVAQALLEDPQLFAPKANLKDGVARLVALPGIGDWTAQYIAMRQLREPDAFASGDIGLINALAALEGGPVSARQLLARAEAWRPLRAYAAQHLWTSLSRGD
ncbi:MULTISPECIES: DNA-3-methyladenine glycosylase family protein [unclassified Pseudomonas]|uniref:DNA-3-methyladenine glycosylase family protein n=1 Tax=unclassified Pseudomonas TaxID=196821 RepID=UPI001F279E17|nr:MULTISPECIES: DNA-3-methyladenine glycosylase [unclassified Pseudomonas]MCF5229609.1 DNA-3-methyladenine glycosylase 2 family protein [Pseudomonas sp. PA-5-4H]MCF5236776.1 DNA-3-methyladenine glycosylase 2 family protein [Pseudomonas sp. PA-5-4G]MCF5248213.1 DNA-3-methyladenine glycosylase 2 family protein [Pseudomonas sp. PA-5-4B]MCF5253262.1 DNA-3-methyladenine glycosylase 2 family protein [Pseudomonas sp. PA-5-4B]MCF5260146.1 DNA-3-methyladenine glycosylase 2 family protein [Pseudomonas 